MTSPVGPSLPLEDPIFLLPSCNVAVTIGTLVAPSTISGATFSTGTYTIHAVAHGLSTGMIVTIAGVVFTGTAAGPNGSGLAITRVDADHFTITTGDSGTFTYSSGGTATETIADTAGSSLFNCGQFSQVTVGASGGTLYLQGIGDTAPVAFHVVAGQVLRGKFQAIGGPTTGSTAGMTLVASR